MNINYDEFFKAIHEAVLKKTNKSKVELLNNGFYCVVGIYPKEIKRYNGVIIMIDGSERNDYLNKELHEFPTFSPFNHEYAYERNYQCFLRNLHSFKKARKTLLFDQDDEVIFDEIIKYIVCSEIASQILYQWDFDDSYLIFDVLRPIYRKQGNNMTQFSHANLDKNVYRNLKNVDAIVDYLADMVMETMDNACLLIAMDMNIFDANASFKKKVSLFVDDLETKESRFKNIVNDNFLIGNENAKLALNAYHETLKYLKQALSEI